MTAAAGKYARYELERRFLVRRLPEQVDVSQGWRLSDRYVVGTHIRLRKAEPLGGGEATFKLGQKEVPTPPDYSRMTMTTIYLSAEEHALFATLPAHQLHKRRYSVAYAGVSYTLDVFDSHLTGLVLAELDVSDGASSRSSLPPWVARDVSDDLRFTGGALAALAADEAKAFVLEPGGPSWRV